MATTAPSALTDEAADAFAKRSLQGQLAMQATLSAIVLTAHTPGGACVPNHALYEQDFYAWTQATVELLAHGRWGEVDLTALQEELQDLGASQYNAVSSDLYQVLIHLLKWAYQPAMQVDSHSWQDSILEHRDRIERLCDQSPSLRRHLPAMLEKEYPRARRRASKQTKLPLGTFPETCPWTLEEVLESTPWPEDAEDDA